MCVSQHAERVCFWNAVKLRHQRCRLLAACIRLHFFHPFKNAAHEAFDDVWIVTCKVCAGEPHVGDEFIGGGCADEHVIAFDTAEIVNVWSPTHAGSDGLIAVKGCGCLEGVFSIDKLHFSWLHAAVHQGV